MVFGLNANVLMLSRNVLSQLARKGSARWVLEADIKGFFDNIAFEWIRKNIPINQVVMEKWLNSGYVDKGVYFPTRAGVPQGGIISPVIAYDGT